MRPTACASSTQSEIVVPVIAPDGTLLAVLDVDSDARAAFDEVDQRELEDICADLGARFGPPSRPAAATPPPATSADRRP